MLLGLLESGEEELEMSRLSIEEVDYDLFTANLAKGVEQLADGVAHGDEELGVMMVWRLLHPAAA